MTSSADENYFARNPLKKPSHASRIREYVCLWLRLCGSMRHRSHSCLGLARRRLYLRNRQKLQRMRADGTHSEQRGRQSVCRQIAGISPLAATSKIQAASAATDLQTSCRPGVTVGLIAACAG